VIGFKAGHGLVDANARGDRKGAHPVRQPGFPGRDEVRQALVGTTPGLFILLAQMMQPHQHLAAILAGVELGVVSTALVGNRP